MDMRRAVRVGSWLLAAVVMLFGLSLAAAAMASGESGAGSGFIAVAAAVAALIVLLAHQPFGRLSLTSLVSLVAAFAAPALLVHDTQDTSGCRALVRTPCDPGLNFHPALRLAVLATLLVAAFLLSLAGFLLSR